MNFLQSLLRRGRRRSRKATEERRLLRELAYRDELTGLPNRVRFRDAVTQAVADAERTDRDPRFAVIVIGLQRFKRVNDALGQHVGDLVLIRVAERLCCDIARSGDFVARTGGDEFSILLHETNTDAAQAAAHRITAAFRTPIHLQGQSIELNAGLGVACYPHHAIETDTLLGRARVALNAAKRRSDGPLLYAASIDADSAQSLQLLGELEQGVRAGELHLHLQPKVSVKGRRITGAETLVRWNHPRHGLVSPMQFIPFAEQTGLIRALTAWVMKEAAHSWLALRAAGLEMPLSVNLSAPDLLDSELPRKFDALLTRLEVPPEAFCLEITEDAFAQDPERIASTLGQLAALGFALSIDDFGTGFSSLSWLQRLPLSELKIDRRFVGRMESESDDARIVHAGIGLAHQLGLRAVAVGVETVGTWERLRALGCDEAQGHHIGSPMPASRFLDWAAEWRTRHRAATTIAAPDH